MQSGTEVPIPATPNFYPAAIGFAIAFVLGAMLMMWLVRSGRKSSVSYDEKSGSES